MKSTKPRILILATGGTIAGAAASSASISSYTSAVTSIDQIVAAVPDIKRVADVTGEQVLQIGSESFNNERLLLLARRVSAVVKSDDVDGVVINGANAGAYEAEFAGELVVTIRDLKADPLGLVFQKGDEKVAAFNEGLAAIKADGTLDALIAKYWTAE